MTDDVEATPPAAKPVVKSPLSHRIALGIALGAVIGFAADEMGLNAVLFGCQHLVAIGCVMGAILGSIRAAKLLWVLAATALAAMLGIAYSPLTPVLIRRLDRHDELVPADAVVVLGGGFVNSDVIGARAQDRLLKGLELLQAGYSTQLVLTRPGNIGAQWPSQAADEMSKLGMKFAIDEVGPVRNTHDEAVKVSELVRQRRWKTVILVTHSWHMRRAAATFERAGVHVLCAPCQDSTCDLVTFNDPSDRLAGFSDWLHENVGYWVYHWRGWI
jgi:uncharacterized SAM-binding protein YcdF (DUF218 family)